MFFSPRLFIFMLRIIFRILIILSSDSILFCWIGIELNTLAFIPFLLIKKTILSTESAVKYFLVQTLASILILIRGVIIKFSVDFVTPLVLGLLIKLGAAPFHRWVVRLAGRIDWIVLFALLTIQKINPLIILCKLESQIIMLRIVFSIIVGRLGGVVQSNVRKLIVYSSIRNIGWLLAVLNINLRLIFLYFSVYAIRLLPALLTFSYFNISYINQLRDIRRITWDSRLLVWSSFFSLGGLPPFLGFFPKIIVLQFLIQRGQGLLSLIMVIFRLWVLFYYLRLLFNSLMLTKSISFFYPSRYKTLTLALVISQLFLGLGVMFTY